MVADRTLEEGRVKWVVLIVDGAAGWACEALGGKTSLEAAVTPHFDALAAQATVGLAATVPAGMEPSSAIACMSVLGFDPSLYYAGRGPIEAMALGIDLAPGQAALRCNLVTVDDGSMRSYAAGHISSKESHELVEALEDALGSDGVRFYPGVGFRHILVVDQGEDLVKTSCTPPHDIADKPVADHLPKGPGAPLLLDLMERSKAVLAEHPVNRARIADGRLPATQVWLFWPGLQAVRMPSFADRYGRRAALTSAVDLLRGLAKQASMETLEIPGVTDGNDNDFAGQMEGAIASLRDYDLVVVHVEAPDEAGHSGDVAAKVEAIEQIDALMVPQVQALAGGVRLLVMPDHPTPLVLRTHVAEPVPFLLWGSGFSANGAAAFTEAEARGTGLLVDPGHELMARFVNG
jgi:2,3-bisphosphoglycerate-independent phosphoglycerate mutase